MFGAIEIKVVKFIPKSLISGINFKNSKKKKNLWRRISFKKSKKKGKGGIGKVNEQIQKRMKQEQVWGL